MATTHERSFEAISTIATLTLNPAVDLSTSVDRVVPEEKLRCERPIREPGGGGVNVSRAVARLGGASTAVLAAGGPTGDVLLGLLNEEGIEHRAVRSRDWTRENVIVSERGSRLQYRFGMPGARLEESEWQACLGELGAIDPAPGLVVGSGSLPPGVPTDFYARLGTAVSERGAKFILDTSGEALRHGATTDGRTFLIKPNLSELQQLAGATLESEEEQERFSRRLIEGGACEVVVLSLGAAGVLLVTRHGSERLRSPTVPIRSKVGAGDSTVAGIVLALARGWSLTEAVRFGVAAGAAAVMTPGTELSRREDAERLYQGLAGVTVSPL